MALVASAAAAVALLVAWVDSNYRVGFAGWGWARPPGAVRAFFARSHAGRLALASGPSPAGGAGRAGFFFSRQVPVSDVAPPPPTVYVTLAQAQLNKAQVDLTRLEKLYAPDVAQGRSNTELDAARAEVEIAKAMLAVRQYESQRVPPPAPPSAPSARFLPRGDPQGWEAFWIRYRNGRGGGAVGAVPPPGLAGGWSVEFPYWMPFLLAAAPLAFAARAARQRRVRLRRGLCASCGYDLRGSGGQCPECGTPAITPAITAPVRSALPPGHGSTAMPPP